MFPRDRLSAVRRLQVATRTTHQAAVPPRGLAVASCPSLALALALLLAVAPSPAAAQSYESHVVVIDSTTTQPVPTGFIPATSNGEVIILAEGSLRTIDDSNRLTEGWFGPAGETRFTRADQPVVDGMPYGALIGGFSSNIANYRHLGRIGAFHLLPQHVGNEFRVALNMSDADLAILQGQVQVTVLLIEDGYPDMAHIVIRDGTALPVPTGLTAAFGDRWVVLPYGTLQGSPNLQFSDAYYTPAGLPHFNRAGQPYPEGPYGGLYGNFDGAPVHFYIGDGGTWRSGTLAVGRELQLDLNLDPADLTGVDGRFEVEVIRVPQ
ncbi:MAG: hypothetical protein ACE15D_07490 [Candidatus Eisenbacteria bacterium]|nr:hypothetical protein [Candidatus Eisenbacteria bacterium]